MLDDEKVVRIEKAIDALEAESSHWTNQMVYAHVGGNYGELSQYLKARRAGEVGGTAVEDAEPASLAEQYQAAQAARSAAGTRLSALNSLSQSQMLSEAEENEQIRLERRLANLTPVIERLQRDMVKEQVVLDITSVQQGWGALVTTKEQAYTAFFAALVQVKAAYLGLVAIHRQQEQALQRLPRHVQERLMYPDDGSFQMNLISRMNDSAGWKMVLGSGEPLALPDLGALQAVDPGTKPLPERLISRALAEGKD